MIRVVCNSCKKAVNVPDKYAGKRIICPGCKSPIAVPANAPAGNPPASKPTSPPPATAPKQPPRKSKKKLLVALITVVLLAGAAAGAWFFFFKSPEFTKVTSTTMGQSVIIGSLKFAPEKCVYDCSNEYIEFYFTMENVGQGTIDPTHYVINEGLIYVFEPTNNPIPSELLRSGDWLEILKQNPQGCLHGAVAEFVVDGSSQRMLPMPKLNPGEIKSGKSIMNMSGTGKNPAIKYELDPLNKNGLKFLVLKVATGKLEHDWANIAIEVKPTQIIITNKPQVVQIGQEAKYGKCTFKPLSCNRSGDYISLSVLLKNPRPSTTTVFPENKYFFSPGDNFARKAAQIECGGKPINLKVEIPQESEIVVDVKFPAADLAKDAKSVKFIFPRGPFCQNDNDNTEVCVPLGDIK